MNIPLVRFADFSNKWEKQKFDDILKKYEDPVATPHDGYERLGVRSHVKGTFHSYVVPGSELETAQMHRVAADKMLFNITFAWEHAVAITDKADEGKLVSHRFPQFTFALEMDPKFFRYIVADDKFRYHLWLSSPGGAGRNRVLNIPEMLEYQTYLPQKLEQTRLADWFSHLDALIVQHQSKLEKLKTLKLSMLEKMFPKACADIPEVRFNGFTKPWQTICLKNIASEITRTDKTSQAPIMMITAAYGFIDQSDRYSFDNAGQSLAKYIVLKKGELAYNHGASKLRPYGSCFALEVDEVYHCFTIDGYNPYFVSRVLNNKKTEKPLRKLVTSGARTDGLLNISYEEYTTITIQLPEKEEQDKIASYFNFKNLEDLITLSQQELEKLQSIKKHCLKKCLSNTGGKLMLFEQEAAFETVIINLLYLKIWLGSGNSTLQNRRRFDSELETNSL